MQNKGVIRLFAIVFALASLYELSFSYVASRVESKIEEDYFANPSKVKYALDSMANQTVYDLGFTSFTYMEVKSKQMNLGLDLRGGMNAILEVSVRDVLKGLVGDAEDELFLLFHISQDHSIIYPLFEHLELQKRALNKMLDFEFD